MTTRKKIRLLSPWSKRIETREAIFSSDFEVTEAEALLCEWAPSEDLFNFSGAKAWYCCEPQCQFDNIDGGRWPGIRARLAKHEFLFHNHPDPCLRVPHITHFQDIVIAAVGSRLDRAIAVVSNFGGGPRSRHKDITYRNRFATCALVDLYGRSSWQKYRERFLSLPRPPANYQGEIPGDWPAREKRDLLSRYKVAVCLESMLEPNYFTEKFVEAVTAGCIPVYRAHESLRTTVLEGAKWVDPRDYDDDPHKTVRAALDMNIEEFKCANAMWAKSERLRATHHLNVLERIGWILSGQRTTH